MEKLTYQQAYDKIIQAYFKDEIKPYKVNFCFCGTLCDGDERWFYGHDSNGYNGRDLKKMESALVWTINKQTVNDGHKFGLQVENDLTNVERHPNYEDALFLGMCAALEVLKQIHKERGEDVDGVPEFTKRILISSSVAHLEL